MASIDAFKGALASTDILRPNRFRVIMPQVPNPFYVKASNLPSTTVGEVEVKFQGRSIWLPGEKKFPNTWTVTVYNEGTGTARRTLDALMQANVETISNIANPAPESIKQQATVQQLNRADAVTQTYMLVGCWVNEIGDVTVDHEEEDTIETFDVQLKFDYHTLV